MRMKIFRDTPPELGVPLLIMSFVLWVGVSAAIIATLRDPIMEYFVAILVLSVVGFACSLYLGFWIYDKIDEDT